MNHRAGPVRHFAGRLLRETGAANTLEAALFAGAVVAVSALAFSATTGSVSRALARVGGLLGASAPSACERAGCGLPGPGAVPTATARSGIQAFATLSPLEAQQASDDAETAQPPPPAR
jgi:hypothetical protein